MEATDRMLFGTLENLIEEQRGFSFKAADLQDMLKPCVYIARSKVNLDEVLYVGMSKNGIARAFGNHHVLSDIRDSIGEVQIYPCMSARAAAQAEVILIHLFQPRYNQNQRETIVAKFLGLSSTMVLRSHQTANHNP